MSAMNFALRRALPVLLATLACARVVAQEPGELWEVTSEMEAAGMSMPATTQQVCSPKNAADEPQGVPASEDCKMYDVQRSGDTLRWKMRCTGSPPTTGSGEMTYSGKDSYRGEMRMQVGGDAMRMKMNGRRLGKACDAGKLKRQVAAAQAESAQYLEQVCQAGVDGMTAYTFTGATGVQCDPKYKGQYCAALKTETGYDKVADMESTVQGPPQMRADLGAATALCGLPATGAGSLESVRSGLCRNALAKESLVFLGRNCRDEGKDLALRECAGRNYTSPVAPKYVEFCNAYARHNALPQEAGASASPESPRDSAIKAGKKALRGLIGF
ncbi:MAG: DUF3617 domain-containing protein [Steroidobacteraceae bacterium]